MGAHSEAELSDKIVRLIKQLHLYLRHFPRFEQRGLTAQIQAAMYGLYQAHADSQRPYNRKSHLNELDKQHNRLRLAVNLAFELGYFGWHDGRQASEGRPASPQQRAERRYHTVSVQIDGIGMQIGGWRKVVFGKSEDSKGNV